MKSRKFIFKKFKGYIITMEVLFALVAWSQIMLGTVYIINQHMDQKYLTNAFVSSAISASKWGGSYSNLYIANGKGEDLAYNISNQLQYMYQNKKDVNLEITPKYITSKDEDICVKMSWSPKGKKGVTLKIEIKSIVQPGKLLGGD